MPYADSGGVKLYVEDSGQGYPIVFVHELGSDLRQWQGQVNWFARQFRCIAFNARGYPPSDVPANDSDYTYEHFVDDIAAVMRHAGVTQAYIVGWSMGAYAALQFGLRHAPMAKAIVAVGVGSGSPPAERPQFMAAMAARAEEFLTRGAAYCADVMAESPTRVQLKRKDPQGWAAFKRDLEQHSAHGMAMTCRNFQGRRPSLEDFADQFAAMPMPVMIMVGDEDAPCLETSLFLKRTIPGAGLWMAPQTGHAPNLEDPAAFNGAVQGFIDAVERGQWRLEKPA